MNKFRFNPAFGQSENGKLVAELDKTINQPRSVSLATATGPDVAGIVSASYLEYPSFSKTVETSGGILSVKASLNGSSVAVSLWIDGTMVDEASGSGNFYLFDERAVSKGKHVVMVKYKASGGTGALSGGVQKLSVLEHY